MDNEMDTSSKAPLGNNEVSCEIECNDGTQVSEKLPLVEEGESLQMDKDDDNSNTDSSEIGDHQIHENIQKDREIDDVNKIELIQATELCPSIDEFSSRFVEKNDDDDGSGLQKQDLLEENPGANKSIVEKQDLLEENPGADKSIVEKQNLLEENLGADESIVEKQDLLEENPGADKSIVEKQDLLEENPGADKSIVEKQDLLEENPGADKSIVEKRDSLQVPADKITEKPSAKIESDALDTLNQHLPIEEHHNVEKDSCIDIDDKEVLSLDTSAKSFLTTDKVSNLDTKQIIEEYGSGKLSSTEEVCNVEMEALSVDKEGSILKVNSDCMDNESKVNESHTVRNEEFNEAEECITVDHAIDSNTVNELNVLRDIIAIEEELLERIIIKDLWEPNITENSNFENSVKSVTDNGEPIEENMITESSMIKNIEIKTEDLRETFIINKNEDLNIVQFSNSVIEETLTEESSCVTDDVSNSISVNEEIIEGNMDVEDNVQKSHFEEEEIEEDVDDGSPIKESIPEGVNDIADNCVPELTMKQQGCSFEDPVREITSDPINSCSADDSSKDSSSAEESLSSRKDDDYDIDLSTHKHLNILTDSTSPVDKDLKIINTVKDDLSNNETISENQKDKGYGSEDKTNQRVVNDRYEDIIEDKNISNEKVIETAYLENNKDILNKDEPGAKHFRKMIKKDCKIPDKMLDINVNEDKLSLKTLNTNEGSSSINSLSQSDKIKSIPGISYIIALKDTMEKNETCLTYDCVLCNLTEEEFVEGSSMKSHIKTREHLLNILELDNYALYNIYKDCEEVTLSQLYEEVSNCETTSDKRIFATKETYGDQRDLVIQNILLRLKFNKEKFDSPQSHSTRSSERIESSDSELSSENDANCNENNLKTDAGRKRIRNKETSSDLSETKIRKRSKKSTETKPSSVAQDAQSAEDARPESLDKEKFVFEKVVIVTNKYYHQYMKLLCPVDIIICPDNSTDSLISTIEKKRKFQPSKTLWLSHTGLFSIAKTVYWDPCQSSKPPCDKPICEVIPDEDVLNGSEDFAGDIKDFTLDLMEKVNSILNPGSAFIIIPPFPPTFMPLDTGYHKKYHNLEEETMLYFASSLSINRFKICYTRLSRDLTSLAVSELAKLGIPKKSLETYKNILSDWNYDIIVISYDIRNPHTLMSYKLSKWIHFLSKFMTDSLVGAHKPKRTRTGTVAKKQIRIVRNSGLSYSRDKRHDYKLKLKKNVKPEISHVSASSSAKSSLKSTVIPNYDHIVFISYYQKQMNLLPNEVKNSNNISILNARSAIDWNDIKDKLDSIKLLSTCKNILFVVIGSIKLLGIEFREPYCLKVNCKEPVSYVNLNSIPTSRLVSGRIKNIQYLLTKLRSQFAGRSKVILSPLFPTKCAEKPNVLVEDHHKALHESMANTNNPLLVLGGKSKWKQAVKVFNSAWEAELFSNLTEREEMFKSLMHQHFSKRRDIIYWQSLRDINVSAEMGRNLNCITFLKKLITTACPILKVFSSSNDQRSMSAISSSSNLVKNKIPSISRSDVEQKTMTSSDNDNNSSFTSDKRYKILNSERPVKLSNRNFDERHYDISDTENDRYRNGRIFNEEPVSKGNLNFIPVQRTCDKTFQHAYIVGAEELGSVLCDKQFENIEHICCNISEVSISSLLKKLGKVKYKSVCFLSLDLSMFTRKVISTGCKKFNCELPIPVLDFNDEKSKTGLDVHSSVMNKIMSLRSLASRLSKHIPVVILPVFPARIYCDNDSTLNRHNTSHLISNAGFCEIGKGEEKWKSFTTLVTNMWNNFVKITYEKYFVSEAIEKSINELNCLIVEDDVTKLPDYSELPKWESIFLSFLDILLMDQEKEEGQSVDVEASALNYGTSIASNKILVMGHSWVPRIADQHTKYECIRGMDIEYVCKIEEWNEFDLIPGNVKTSHTHVLIFGVVNDAYKWSRLGRDGTRAIYPNEDFSAEDYALKMETFVKACRRINPRIRIILMLPPILDLVYYNKSSVSNYKEILRGKFETGGNVDLWLHKKSLEVHTEITRLKFNEIQWLGKIVYPLQYVVQSIKNLRSCVSLFMKGNVLTFGEHGYLDDGIHPSQTFIDKMWEKILASNMWVAQSEEAFCAKEKYLSSSSPEPRRITKTKEGNLVVEITSAKDESVTSRGKSSNRVLKKFTKMQETVDLSKPSEPITLRQPVDSRFIASEVEKAVTYIVGYSAGGGQSMNPEEVKRLMVDYLNTSLGRTTS